jgi:hypothetical protein
MQSNIFFAFAWPGVYHNDHIILRSMKKDMASLEGKDVFQGTAGKSFMPL